MLKGEKRIYSTEYKQGGNTYSSYLWAQSAAHAVRIAKIRGLDEVVTESAGTPKHITWGDLRASRGLGAPVQRLHYLTFLAFVAMKSSIYTVDRVMGDKGWYHEYIHRLHIKREPLNKSQKEITSDIHTAEKLLGFIP